MKKSDVDRMIDMAEKSLKNERIHELIQLAYQQTRATPGLIERKLAELIIRECICQCDDVKSQEYIMAHFGMKESDWK